MRSMSGFLSSTFEVGYSNSIMDLFNFLTNDLQHNFYFSRSIFSLLIIQLNVILFCSFPSFTNYLFLNNRNTSWNILFSLCFWKKEPTVLFSFLHEKSMSAQYLSDWVPQEATCFHWLVLLSVQYDIRCRQLFPSVHIMGWPCTTPNMGRSRYTFSYSRSQALERR